MTAKRAREKKARQAGKRPSPWLKKKAALAEPAPEQAPEPKEKIKEKIIAHVLGEAVITEGSDAARELYASSRFGEIRDDACVQLSLFEAMYLLEKGKTLVRDSRKELDAVAFMKKAKRLEPNFWVRYCVYKDMRNRGYIVKTALKFGADFRVYDRGVKPGEDHARWVLFPVHEGDTLTWFEFAAKNRVAHSTKKRLMIAVVDAEGSVSYWENRWLRP